MIARQGSGARETFTVRKQSFGVGVERTFPVHSPKIERLEVVARGDVRRAKLYYLRGRVGKRARVAERRWGSRTTSCSPSPRPEAIDSEGVGQEEAETDAPSRRRSDEERAEGEAAEAGSGAEEARSSRMRTGSEIRRGRSREPRGGRSPRNRTDPEPKRARRGPRAGRDRRAGDRARARDPGLRRQALPDPLAVDGADARRRPAGARQPASPTVSAPIPSSATSSYSIRRSDAAPGGAGREGAAADVRRPDADRERGQACPLRIPGRRNRTSSSASSASPATG